jgi:hypothetical protein
VLPNLEVAFSPPWRKIREKLEEPEKTNGVMRKIACNTEVDN